MAKRIFDLFFSSLILVIIFPILFIVLILIYFQDFKNPLYTPKRVGKDNNDFTFIKFRSMKFDADKTGVDSTSANDSRITSIGFFIRRYKIDELSQLLNVLIGDMSLVGPRPNVRRDVELYSSQEIKLLSVRPGITDFSSIVFADEGDILVGYDDPDLAYNQLIRPWKSRLGILYIENHSIFLDIKLLYLTILSLFSRKKALKKLCLILKNLNADSNVIKAASRQEEFVPFPPPGLDNIVESRDS